MLCIEYFIIDKKFKAYHPMSFLDSMWKVDLPILQITCNGKTFNFLIDSGANNSVITIDDLKDFNYKMLDKKGKSYGVDGNQVETTSALVKIYHDDLCFEEIFQLFDVKGFKELERTTGMKISGVLGNSFLSKYDFILDYEKFLLYLPRKSFRKIKKEIRYEKLKKIQTTKSRWLRKLFGRNKRKE